MAITVVTRSGRTNAGGLVAAIRDIFGHFELLRLLVVKDLKIKYKASAIGLLWSLLNPLLMMLVYTAIFGTVFKTQRPQFPIFILAGLLTWNYLGLSLPAATLAIVGNGNLVKKTRFPTALLPLSVTISGLINFLISLTLLFGLVAFYRHPLGWSLVLVPVLVVAQFAFTSGVGLLLSSLNVLFRDVEHFLGILLTVWFFSTPIIYPREAIHGSRLASLILGANPMTWLIESYQRIFYSATWPNPRPLLGFIALSIAALVIGFVVFERLSHRFVEEV